MLFPEMIKKRLTFNGELWKSMMIYALPLLIAGLAGMTNETIDRILLKHLLPEGVDKMEQIGIYGAFYKISIIMILFTQTFRFAAEPFFFAHEKKHIADMKSGKLDYDDNFVYWKGKKYSRAKMDEGNAKLPWEDEAYDKA